MTILVLLAILHRPKSARVETNLFCAYNRVFVEFEENGSKWGTMMLDSIGRPIPCFEHDEVKIENTI
jgi:hypothetical protein